MYSRKFLVLLVGILYLGYSSCYEYDQRDPKYTDYQHYPGCVGTFCQDAGTSCANSFPMKEFGYKSNSLIEATSNRCKKEDGSYGVSSLCCDKNAVEGKWIKDNGAKGNEYPFVASILADWRPDVVFLFSCSASIYNKDWIITAAHCISKAEDKSQIANKVTVTLGASHLMQEHDPERVFTVTGRHNIIKHEGYTDETGMNDDIALLKLDRPIPNFDKYVQPLRMPVKGENPFDSKVGIPLGYGKGPFGYSAGAIWGYPLNLTQPNGANRPLNNCDKLAGNSKFDMATKICVGGRGRGGIGTGHSGGPLLCMDKSGKPYQCGVSSFSHATCNLPTSCPERMEFPSVYTNLEYYMDWIHKKTRGAKQNPRETMKKLKHAYVEGEKWSRRQ